MHENDKRLFLVKRQEVDRSVYECGVYSGKVNKSRYLITWLTTLSSKLEFAFSQSHRTLKLMKKNSNNNKGQPNCIELLVAFVLFLKKNVSTVYILDSISGMTVRLLVGHCYASINSNEWKKNSRISLFLQVTWNRSFYFISFYFFPMWKRDGKTKKNENKSNFY